MSIGWVSLLLSFSYFLRKEAWGRMEQHKENRSSERERKAHISGGNVLLGPRRVGLVSNAGLDGRRDGGGVLDRVAGGDDGVARRASRSGSRRRQFCRGGVGGGRESGQHGRDLHGEGRCVYSRLTGCLLSISAVFCLNSWLVVSR